MSEVLKWSSGMVMMLAAIGLEDRRTSCLLKMLAGQENDGIRR